MEPESLTAITERGQMMGKNIKHPVQYFHLPVPLSAMDKLEKYYEPLKALIPTFKQDGTELYLGLVHFGDLEGTKQRIEVAKKVLGDDVEFGISSECGWGRTPINQLEDIMKQSRELSTPVV